jgi:hypothetical protein
LGVLAWKGNNILGKTERIGQTEEGRDRVESAPNEKLACQGGVFGLLRTWLSLFP